jgi:hypothetical protein
MKILRLSLVVLLLLLTTSATSPNAWKYSIGATYRQFDDLEFEALPVTRQDGADFVTGKHQNATNFVIEDSPQLDPAGWTEASDPNGDVNSTADNDGDETFVRNVFYDSASFGGGSESSDGAFGLTLQASQQVDDQEYLDFNLGFGLFRDQANSEVEAATTTRTGLLMQTGGAPTIDQPPMPYIEENGAVLSGGPTNLGMTNNLFDLGSPAVSRTTLELDADAEVYVLSLGFSWRYVLDEVGPFTEGLSFYAGGGPTMTIVDAETTVTQSAVWDAPGSTVDGNPVPNFARADDDRELGVEPGFYATLGAGYSFNDRLDLYLGYRYDEVLGEVSTSHAEFDLDGHSLECRVTYWF